MITNQKNIVTVINAFHDGSIIFHKKEDSNQIWKISCPYLAEVIDPSFSFFWLSISECASLQFRPWLNSINAPEELWTNTKDIFESELDIISASIKNENIAIICDQHDSHFEYSGGELLLNCKGVELFDQRKRKIRFSELRELFYLYWDNI
ncbi:MAG: hypothetical protein AAF391_09750 [Bacteroidota bacterium]